MSIQTEHGGTESSMQYFRENVPGVENLYDSKRKRIFSKTERIQNKENRNQILSTIPIAGGQ
jgi:hypothetical protein